MDNLNTDTYFYGNGSAAFQDIGSNDTPTGPLKFYGNADSVKTSLTVERKEKRESRSGRNRLVRSKVIFVDGNIEITINENHRSNLELFLFGETAVRDAVSDHADEKKIQATSEVGQVYRLEYQNVSGLVITDDGAANAVVSDTKYEVDDVYGKVKVLEDLGTGPFTVTYDAEAANVIPVFQLSDKPIYFRHEGINIGNDEDEPFLLELWKIKLDPVADLELITNEYGQFVLKGRILESSWANTADPVYGKTGRYVELEAGANEAESTLTITTTSVPSQPQDTPYFARITATGGSKPYTFTIDGSGDPLPADLELNQQNNEAFIVGLPATAETLDIVVKVTDDDGNTDTQALSLVISA
jgi:hypothetical protein